MCMNVDLWPLPWPLQPPCKFTGGSESVCLFRHSADGSSKTHLIRLRRQTQTNAEKVKKTKPGQAAWCKFIKYLMMDDGWSWILGQQLQRSYCDWSCLLACEWNLTWSTILKNDFSVFCWDQSFLFKAFLLFPLICGFRHHLLANVVDTAHMSYHMLLHPCPERVTVRSFRFREGNNSNGGS